MKRSAIYAGVSTLHQSETYIEKQIQTCKKFCQDHGFEVKGIFQDKQIGGKADRIGLTTMIEHALNGEYNLILRGHIFLM